MKCNKCGEQWETPMGKSHSFCPSCGNKVEFDKKEAQNLDTAQGVLAHIADNFGTDMLLGSKIVSYFADITRSQLSAEKKLIKILADEGALDCLKEAIGKPESEQAVAIKRAVACLPFAKAEGEEMLYNFAAALGWQLPKSQPAEILKPIVQQQPQQAFTAALPNDNKTSRTINVKPTVGSIHKFASIDWRVLAVENDKALLISEKILEKRPYHQPGGNITWENCTLRKYLNGEFLNSLGEVKSSISKTRNNPNPINQWFGTAGGSVTADKVFLLSLDEVCRYFGDSTANLSKKGSTGSYYWINDKNNAARIANYGSEKASWWWLRSPGYYRYIAASVDDVGYVYVIGSSVSIDSGGVRPALWLNL